MTFEMVAAGFTLPRVGFCSFLSPPCRMTSQEATLFGQGKYIFV